MVALANVRAEGAQPSLRLTLVPVFNGPNHAVSTVNLTLELRDESARAGRPLLTMGLNNGATPTQRYDGDSLVASDAEGALGLSYADTNESNVQRTWVPARDPVGDITVRFVATPREESTATGAGPRIDLKKEQGGAVGQGSGFIPYPPDNKEWIIHINWVLSETAPPDTTAVSSLGDSLQSSDVGVPSKVLAKSYFAVGQLRRISPPGPSQGSDRVFAMYWIGTFPWPIDSVAATTKRLVSAISTFFKDTTSPYRVFLRSAAAGVGGAGGYHSFLLEYTPGVEAEYSEDVLTNFLIAHESVHNYALMFPTRQYDTWYREGVANYYAAVAPFQAGAVDRAYLVRWLNNYAQAYYTGPSVNMTWQYVLDHYWTMDVVKTSYTRGFIYMTAVQGLVAAATGGKKGVDDIVLELYRRYIAGEVVQSQQFLQVLADTVGRETAEESFGALLNGTLIVPPTDGFSKFGLKMVREDAEKFDMGYSVAAVGGKPSLTLKRGSRAEAAGLRDGDEYVRAWGFWNAGDALENMMQVVVRRNGQEVTFKYWPRTYDKVEAWVWVVDPLGRKQR